MDAEGASRVEVADRGHQKPRRHRWLSAGGDRKVGACGWSVVQLNYDGSGEPLFGRYGAVQAELELQRTIKGAELTAFLCLLRRVNGSTTAHVDNKRNN